MFTGLIQTTGRLTGLVVTNGSGRLSLDAHFPAPLEPGESVAVNGVCLTLVKNQEDRLEFDVLPETLSKTALSDKKAGDLLNLERALRMGDLLGGHLVSGHVDGTGILRRREKVGRDWALFIEAPVFLPEILVKGSIAVDGVSLTVVEKDPAAGWFSVQVIPHTWNQTALSSLRVGERVNLETDLIGKYVRAALATKTGAPALSWERLREAGFLD